MTLETSTSSVHQFWDFHRVLGRLVISHHGDKHQTLADIKGIAETTLTPGGLRIKRNAQVPEVQDHPAIGGIFNKCPKVMLKNPQHGNNRKEQD